MILAIIILRASSDTPLEDGALDEFVPDAMDAWKRRVEVFDRSGFGKPPVERISEAQAGEQDVDRLGIGDVRELGRFGCAQREHSIVARRTWLKEFRRRESAEQELVGVDRLSRRAERVDVEGQQHRHGARFDVRKALATGGIQRGQIAAVLRRARPVHRRRVNARRDHLLRGSGIGEDEGKAYKGGAEQAGIPGFAALSRRHRPRAHKRTKRKRRG
jgi:hypothetical protein